jgi:hypothetical protein
MDFDYATFTDERDYMVRQIMSLLDSPHLSKIPPEPSEVISLFLNIEVIARSARNSLTAIQHGKDPYWSEFPGDNGEGCVAQL